MKRKKKKKKTSVGVMSERGELNRLLQPTVHLCWRLQATLVTTKITPEPLTELLEVELHG